MSDLFPRYKRTIGIINNYTQIGRTFSAHRFCFYCSIIATNRDRVDSARATGDIDGKRGSDGICRIVIGFDTRDMDTGFRDIFTGSLLLQVEYKKTVGNTKLRQRECGYK